MIGGIGIFPPKINPRYDLFRAFWAIFGHFDNFEILARKIISGVYFWRENTYICVCQEMY